MPQDWGWALLTAPPRAVEQGWSYVRSEPILPYVEGLFDAPCDRQPGEKPTSVRGLSRIPRSKRHGRRRGWLSNLHLGARDAGTGDFVMVGKCFKVLTDDLLEWQTRELLARETGRRGIAVNVRPELVVEIALDGVQVSTRYEGGVALRFARVKRYRQDKNAGEADTVDELRGLLAGRQ